jgi:hypothetical protein
MNGGGHQQPQKVDFSLYKFKKMKIVIRNIYVLKFSNAFREYNIITCQKDEIDIPSYIFNHNTDYYFCLYVGQIQSVICDAF